MNHGNISPGHNADPDDAPEEALLWHNADPDDDPEALLWQDEEEPEEAHTVGEEEETADSPETPTDQAYPPRL